MGQSKKQWEKTIPIFERQAFQRELDFHLLVKEKSQSVQQSKKTK